MLINLELVFIEISSGILSILYFHASNFMIHAN